MKTQFLDEITAYDGTQLHSHWIFDQTGLLGDSVVAFIGPCQVDRDKLVDLEDAKNDRPIHSREMLHFIGEWYRMSLAETILLQRLLISLVQQRLHREVVAQGKGPLQTMRSGNDLYDGEAKLTVSIATASSVSTLLHAGINVRSEGTPVLTKGLHDYHVDPVNFAERVLADFAEEFQSVNRDLAKVRAVP